MNASARFAFVLLLVAAVDGMAGEFGAPAPDTAMPRAWWAMSVGCGVASRRNDGDVLNRTALLGSASLQEEASIITARYTRFSTADAAGDVAFLYEHAFSRRRWLVSAGAGFGFRHHRKSYLIVDKSSSGSEHGDLALAWSLQAVSRRHAAAGLGAIVYGSVNSDGNLLGVGLVMHLGKLEQAPPRDDRR